MEKISQVQESLLDIIKQKNPELKLVEIISRDLKLSPDSAYRRINKKISFSLDELLFLAKKYNISIDNLSGIEKPKEMVLFQFMFHDHEYDFKEYLQNILKNFEIILQTNSKLIYLAKDIPIFYNMGYPYLGKFKTLYYLKTMLNQRAYQDTVFSEFDDYIEYEHLANQINKTYFKIESIEIWNLETTHSVISQVEYYFNLGFISTHEALLILEDLNKLIKQVLLFAEQEQKFSNDSAPKKDIVNYKLFYNEVFAADNSIFAKGPTLKAAYLPSINLKYMTTTDPHFCTYIEDVFNLVIKKSTLISGVNERDRKMFFNYTFDRIEKTKLKLNIN
jgi:hypothetical protein